MSGGRGAAPMGWKSRGVPVTAAVALLGVVLSGCSETPGEASSDNTVVVAVGGEPTNLNPVFGDIFGSIYGDHWPIFSSLLDNDQALDLQPDLAAQMPDVSADGREVTVEVRTDATWHDGEPVTAEDVVFTYESILDSEVATSLRGLLFDSLAGVEAVDEHTIRFTLSRTDPAFLEKLTTGIVPEHLLSDQDLNTASFNLDPVGSGPFVFTELRPGERMVLTANEEYYGGTVGIERLVVRFISDEGSRARQLESGAVDIDAEGLGPRTVERFEDAADHRVVRIPGDLLTLTLPTSNPLFSTAELRRALGMAIDREALVEGLHAGSGRPINGPFFPGHWAYDEHSEAEFDPAEAETILADAGWVAGEDGVLTRDGERFSFDLIYGHGSVADAAALAVRDALAQTGVEVSPVALEFAEQQERIASGAASLQSLGNAYDPALDLFTTYHSSLADNDPSGNVAQVNSPEIDQAIEDGRLSRERDARADAYRRLQRLLAAQGSWQYLLQGDNYYVVPSWLEGVDPQVREGHVHGFSRGLLWNVQDWRVASP